MQRFWDWLNAREARLHAREARLHEGKRAKDARKLSLEFNKNQRAKECKRRHTDYYLYVAVAVMMFIVFWRA